MEREGRGRRRGVEMKKGRRGIVIGGMVIGLLMGCNNGGELEAEKRLSAIGKKCRECILLIYGSNSRFIGL